MVISAVVPAKTALCGALYKKLINPTLSIVFVTAVGDTVPLFVVILKVLLVADPVFRTTTVIFAFCPIFTVFSIAALVSCRKEVCAFTTSLESRWNTDPDFVFPIRKEYALGDTNVSLVGGVDRNVCAVQFEYHICYSK